LRWQNKKMKTDVVIVGCGVAGLYCALHLPKEKNIVIVTKDVAQNSDSFLAQGGICVLKDESDYEAFFQDTMRAGHYENNPESVDIMIRSSRDVIGDLVSYGVRFERSGTEFVYTKEGAHSKPRILFHEDETGKEITSRLLERVRTLENVTLVENYTMVDIIAKDNVCYGIIGHNAEGEYSYIQADYTVFATGGIGGLFAHSTNYPHLTGDAIAVALERGIRLRNIDYIQIHPTTFYSEEGGREFLISESVRGEGAILLNDKGERFVDELQPRDVVTEAIFAEMKKEGKPHVWLSTERIPEQEFKTHFPHIYEHCLQAGYDVTKESIPVVPSQHYFMGGIEVDSFSGTSMQRLYAVGETACNGVHGKNRLASNSLLESLVFAKRAAKRIAENYQKAEYGEEIAIAPSAYANYQERYKKIVLEAIEKEKKKDE
jgi:L-aspartate oxidase